MEILNYVIDLVAVLLLALGIKGLSKVRSARSANQLAAVAMALAVIGLLISYLGTPSFDGQAWIWIIIGTTVGGVLGAITAQRVPMTSMPETVALFNGCGGMSSLLVALAAALFPGTLDDGTLVAVVSIVISVFVGSITFTGSIVAMAKLQGWLSTPPWMQSKIRHLVNIALAVVCLVAAIKLITSDGSSQAALWLLVIASGLLGIGVTLPIGGADMPVVITVLNSYSGWALCAEGFMLNQPLLTTVGALIGASGAILTHVMCVAMNRDIASVLLGGYGTSSTGSGEAMVFEGEARFTDIDTTVERLTSAQNVVVVPGYGLAVANGQYAIAEMTSNLRDRDVNVRFGIHPVAGRMPGQLNVLLAEVCRRRGAAARVAGRPRS